MAKEYKEWQVPPAATKESERRGWLDEAVQEGQIWHKQQRGYADYLKAFKVLSGDLGLLDTPSYRSTLTSGRLKRNIREVIGACANIRPIWAYQSDNDAFSEECNMMNKVTRAVYLERNLDLGIKEALQWSAATATGWLRPVYRRRMYGTGKGDLTFLTYGSPSILPTQLPANADWQEAYAVTIMDELPIAMAHGMFPKFQDRLKPTSSKYWYSPEIRKAARGNLFRRIWGGGKRDDMGILSDLFTPVRYTYIIDLTLNETGNMIPMGQPGTSWYYEVPSLNSDIPSGRDNMGNPTYRKANENDARLYPYRRLIISGEEVIMYDGPAFDWHGEFPAIPFCLDKWAWEALGLSLLRDGIQVDGAINELERGILDKHRARLDPSMAYDINSVNREEARSFDPMAPRQRIGFDGTLVQQPFVPVTPDEMLRVDPSTMAFVEHLKDTEDYQVGDP